MEPVELSVSERQVIGKRGVKRLRRDGMIPGVIYSQGKEAKQFAINDHHYRMTVANKSIAQIYHLQSESSELNGVITLIKSVQVEPIKSKILHVDFYEVTKGTKVVVPISIRVVGDCVAVKQGLAILNQAAYELEVECLPTEIPPVIEVDISDLEPGVTIHAGDLTLPDNVTLKTDPSIEIVGTLAKRAEEPSEADATDADAGEATGAAEEAKTE